ncbi:hypothetical protein N8T08_010355 [Aspergillus melleus]|uniref:Uncharacterized protein n=1 Tax=Aspergillus melleus TaxID=138277 RepID=A0ACC3ASC3_9EURO|nr:hypothetical protein N8T08_010355 [Aspergillus melleus]
MWDRATWRWSRKFFSLMKEVLGLDGLQAEYVRVPFADDGLIPVPLTHSSTISSIERDYLTVSDIFATGWSAMDYSGFEPDDTVAIFGAGPVGLLAAYSALLRGASRTIARHQRIGLRGHGSDQRTYKRTLSYRTWSAWQLKMAGVHGLEVCCCQNW